MNMATKYDDRITTQDLKILHCLTYKKWSDIIDDGMQQDIDLLRSFDADSILPSIRGYGITLSEEDMIKSKTTKMDKAHKLLTFVRLRPNIALSFIDLLFKSFHDNVANKMLDRYRRIIQVQNESDFQASLIRQYDKIEVLSQWALTSLLRKECISNQDYGKIENSQKKGEALMSILTRKHKVHYQNLIDYLIEINMMTLVADLLNAPEDQVVIQNCDLKRRKDSTETERRRLPDHNQSVNETCMTSSQDKDIPLAVDYYDFPQNKFKVQNFTIRTSTRVDEFLMSIKSGIGHNTDNAFAYCMTLVIRDGLTNFRSSWEAFVDFNSQVRNYTSEEEEAGPGEILQLGIYPLTEQFPTFFNKLCTPIRPIIRIAMDSEAWVISTKPNRTNFNLKRCENLRCSFDDVEFVAMMRGVTQYNKREASNPINHFIFTNDKKETYVNLSDGQSVLASDMNVRGYIYKLSFIFLREGEELPRLKRVKQKVHRLMIHLREGISLTLHDGSLKRIYPDTGNGNRWLYCLNQSPLIDSILNHLYDGSK